MNKLNFLEKWFSRLFHPSIKTEQTATRKTKDKTNIRKQLSDNQKESTALVNKLIAGLEKSYKNSSNNLMFDYCIEWYGKAFNRKGGAIGETFIGQKVIPRAVPVIKSAIDDLIRNTDVKLDELTSKENMERLYSYKTEGRKNASTNTFGMCF